jgi:hypothetical protein
MIQTQESKCSIFFCHQLRVLMLQHSRGAWGRSWFSTVRRGLNLLSHRESEGNAIRRASLSLFTQRPVPWAGSAIADRTIVESRDRLYTID